MGADGSSYPTFAHEKLWVCLTKTAQKSFRIILPALLQIVRQKPSLLTRSPCALAGGPAFLHFPILSNNIPAISGTRFTLPFSCIILILAFLIFFFTLRLSEGNYSSLATEFAVVPPLRASMNHLPQRRWKAPR